MLQFLVLTALMLGLVTLPRSQFLGNALFLLAVLFLGLAAAELYFRNFNPNLAKSRGASWEGSFIPSRRGRALVAGELTRWLSQLPKRPRVAHDG
jgi:hypothetical protein